jgi:hypothetical protein
VLAAETVGPPPETLLTPSVTCSGPGCRLAAPERLQTAPVDSRRGARASLCSRRTRAARKMHHSAMPGLCGSDTRRRAQSPPAGLPCPPVPRLWALTPSGTVRPATLEPQKWPPPGKRDRTQRRRAARLPKYAPCPPATSQPRHASGQLPPRRPAPPAGQADGFALEYGYPQGTQGKFF